MTSRFREIMKENISIQPTYAVANGDMANFIQMEVFYDKGEGRRIRGFYVCVTPVHSNGRFYTYNAFDAQTYRMTACDRYSAKAEEEARKTYSLVKPQLIRDCVARFDLKLKEE